MDAKKGVKRIGVISDTHGLLREEAIKVLAGSDIIIHAGDVGNQEIIAELGCIAPVYAVRGNNDRGDWARELPNERFIEFEGLFIYVIHDMGQMDFDPLRTGVDIVIYGHSHRPMEKRENGVIFLNPGGAGYKRFNLPITLAVIKVGHISREISPEQQEQAAESEGSGEDGISIDFISLI